VRRSLVAGTVAAVVALVVALAAVAGVLAVTDDGDDDDALPEPEVELTFEAEDAEDPDEGLIGGEVTGTRAPDVSIPLLDGGSTTLAELAGGRPMVVNFFANWCVPCREELPAFQAVHERYGDQIAFVGISVQESPDAARALLEETGVTFPAGRDPSGDLSLRFEVVNMPSTFLLAADGTIVDSASGALTEGQLLSRIQEHLLP